MYYDDEPEVRFQQSLASEPGKYQNTIGYNKHRTQWKTLGITVASFLGAWWLFCSMTGISFEQQRVRSPHEGQPKWVSKRDRAAAERPQPEPAKPEERDAFEDGVDFLRHLIQ